MTSRPGADHQPGTNRWTAQSQGDRTMVSRGKLHPRDPHSPESDQTGLSPANLEPRSQEADPAAERLAYSVDEAARLTGLSRDLLYDEMRRGNLSYRKVGRRRVITRQDLEQFLGLAS